MNNISDQVIQEFLEEEISKIMFFIDHHNQWKLHAANSDEWDSIV